MKTLHLYLLRQVLATLFMTVMVFTLVLLLGNALREIMALLINRQATLVGVFQALGLLIPFVLVFALPMGMLTAALLVFGRFSADQELTAVRASGISLVALVTPILLLSLLLCGLSAWINMEIAPHCRIAYKNLLSEMGQKLSNAALPEGRYVKDFAPYSFFIGSNDGKELRDVFVIRADAEGQLDMTLSAARGRLETTNGQMTVLLFDVHELDRQNGTWSEAERSTVALTDFKQTSSREDKIGLSDMTFGQLRAELRNLDQRFSLPNSPGLGGDDLRRQMQQLNDVRSDMTMPVLVQMHRQVAGAFACFGFTLVGIPLGIRAHRRETNIGIAMALGLVLIYYSFLILGQALQTRAEFAPYLIVWLPNFIFEAAGVVMLWRANRGI